MDVNGQFQAKTAKYKSRNISKTINRIKTKFGHQAETGNCMWSITQIKSNMAAGGHLEKNRYNVKFRSNQTIVGGGLRSSDYYEIWQTDAK